MKGENPERIWEFENQKNYEEMKYNVKRRLRRIWEKYYKKIKKKVKKPVKFNKGDLVIIKNLQKGNRNKNEMAKLQLLYEEPYIVKTENAINSYELEDPYTNKIREIFNIENICKLAFTRGFARMELEHSQMI